MKKLFTILFVLVVATTGAHTKDEKELTEKTYLLRHIVFGTKDSALEKLVARIATYGNSHGNIQTREEMIKGVSRNHRNMQSGNFKVENLGIIRG